jgi:peptidyl-prolyl cis-trans isomerase C
MLFLTPTNTSPTNNDIMQLVQYYLYLNTITSKTITVKQQQQKSHPSYPPYCSSRMRSFFLTLLFIHTVLWMMGTTGTTAFMVGPTTNHNTPTNIPKQQQQQRRRQRLDHSSSKKTTTTTTTTTTRLQLDLGSMFSNWGKKVTASHILIGPSTSVTGRGMTKEDAIATLNQLKEDIDNDPVKFAEAAKQYSSCRGTSAKGGDLGEFGPGVMVGSFDKVCFQEAVGVVHGPISTPYGEHLILVRSRTGEN